MAVDAARAKSLFLTASDFTDPAERAAYLQRECGGDAELRARVEALLAADGGGAPVLDDGVTAAHEPTSPATLEATADSRAETRLPSELATAEDRSDGADFTLARAPQADRPGGSGVGQVIAGRYTLLEVLGEGGMGTVYRAGQAAPVKRQVALKLIKVGMDSRAVLARFDAERQALALMDHPNIARVYNGGTTEAGQPFFVMELVSGEPITDYCDRKRLSVRDRLELFVAVCQAVQHAHQKGIIHRDLKPSNVMVTEVDGRATPKVIDFGVAKATEFKLTDQSLRDTGAIVGTPTYMSPEQADPSSMDIDTRTDVYALGVILYELLVGSPPLDARQFKRGAILEMLRMVREVDPPSPSTKVSTAEALPSIAASRNIEPAHLKRALEGDLDWIVMMALEKDRSRRYETANGFAADILRHLAHEPVVAAPPSRAYRLRKFLRKHRGAVIAASLVLLSLLGGLAAVAAVQTVANSRLAASLVRETNANAALNEANGQLTKSRAAVQARYELATDAIKTFHTGVSEDFLLKEEEFKELRNRLLKSASDFYGKLAALLGKETDIASRRALAQANFELAELTLEVGREEDALAAHRQVLAARVALAAESQADPEIKADVGSSLTVVGVLLNSTGKTKEAEETYRKVEDLLAEPAPTIAGAAAVRAVLAECRQRHGWLLYYASRYDEAMAILRPARADLEALAAAPGATADIRASLASTVDLIGVVLGETGKKSEAEAETRKALAMRQKLADDNPAVTKFRRSASASHNNLGVLMLHTGRLSEALAALRESLALDQKLADDNPAVTSFRAGVAVGHKSLGYMLTRTGNVAEADAELRKSLELLRKLADDYPDNIHLRRALAQAYGDVGYLLTWTGKPAEAAAELRQNLALWQKLVDDNPKVPGYREGLASSFCSLADATNMLGRETEARTGYERAITLFERLVAENPTRTDFRIGLAWSLRRRGLARRGSGDPAGAAADARRALALYQGLPSRAAEESFDEGCCHALLGGLAGRDGAGVSAGQGEAETAQAMAVLRKAVGMGYRDPRFQTDSTLDPLRQREDFRKLLAEVENQSAAKPEKSP
jgi:serine/threonine protein kinase/tetratricopeptide (TPR) repeat protein